MTLRQDKLNSLLKKLTARFLQENADTGILLTVTNFTISKDLRNAVALVTIFPADREEEILAVLQSKRGALQDHLATNTKIKRVPLVSLKIDMGEKSRQRLYELLKK